MLEAQQLREAKAEAEQQLATSEAHKAYDKLKAAYNTQGQVCTEVVCV